MGKAARIYTAKALKVHTGEVLGRVAEGEAVYISHRGRAVARVESLVHQRAPDEIRRMLKLIDEEFGSLRDELPSSDEYNRSKHRQERQRDRKLGLR